MDNTRRVEQPNSDFSKKCNLDQNIKSKKKSCLNKDGIYSVTKTKQGENWIKPYQNYLNIDILLFGV
jgi:hypothetical protein